MKCEPVSCKKSEQCAVKKGIRDCYPTTYGSCKCSGDPHCRTFDNKKFDFQGTCTYVLAQLVEGSQQNLEPFQVLVTNEHRGRKTSVSFTKSAFLTVFGNVTVGMSRIKPGQITVNGQAVNLPFNFEDGKLIALRQRRFGVVKTYFGLTLKFDWSAHVKVILPSSYSEETVGLCGNFNGNKGDDYLKLDGTQTKNVNEFGGSWKVGGDFGCTSDCPGGKCPECEPAMIPLYQGRRYCGIISDKEGPFSQCHSKLDPTEFLSDCVFDMCMYKGHASALCSSLSAFSSACQDAGAKVESWRSENFCPLSCPANSHYELCADPCQLTCSDLAPADGCDEGASCGEDCVCDDGFIMSHDKCVPVAECGCQDGGQYYQNGQTFFRGQSCDTRCVCSDGGQIQCDSTFKCSEHEKCVLKDGSNSCEPKSIGSCSVSGVRTIRSFDGQEFPLWGDCLFILSEVQRKDGGKPAYSVLVEQKTVEDGSVSRNVVIKVEDTEFTMEAGVSWEVKVDGIRVSLPLSLNEGKVRVYQNGIHIVVETDFGLKLTYNTVADLVLQIPSTYHSAPSGLCGNFNADPSDDSKEGKGDPLASAAFWVVEKDDVQCEVGCGDAKCPGPVEEEVPESQKACDIIKSAQGPFEGCHSSVSPTPFYDICVREMATHKGGDKLLCQHIQSYVTQCQLAGAKIKEWRSDKFCPLTCPSGSHYDLCPSTSSSTCSSLQDSAAPPACQEGCQCDDDLLFDGAKCVPVEKCGCSVDGRYYKAGTSVLSEGCSKICSCESGVLSCEDFSCQEGEECSNKDGTIDCFSTVTPAPPPPKDPCEDVQCRSKERCVNGECVHTSTATCKAMGDPHFCTFDGRRYDFQGSCTYTMATVAKPADDLTPFTVTVKNNHRGSKRVTYVRTVTVTVHGQTIVISMAKGRVEVNGELQHLPVNLLEGKVTVRRSGGYALLATDFGLVVKYDWNMRLIITAPSSYFDHMGGLCGNYNGDKKDDLPDPKSKSIPIVLEMIKNWKVEDPDLFCSDNCGGRCPQCSLTQQEHFRNPKLCGLMSKEDGPFAACHKTVHPSGQLDDCVYDVCANNGAKKILCEHLEIYVESCLSEGVKVGAEWREQSGCIPSCPAGSHYESCGSACPASCSALDSKELCKDSCVGGCQCDEGRVLSGDRCVPQAQCGCQYQSKYYPAGAKFWGDNTCTSRCECKNGKAECEPVSCKKSEQCAVKKGIRDCYPTTYGSCKCSGDPHCRTFDNKKFDFQGTCTYVLAQLVEGSQQNLEPFQVLVTNEHRGRKTSVSFTKSAFLTVFGNVTVGMSRIKPGQITVNGQAVNLPFNFEDGKLIALRQRRFGVVKTYFGLTLKFDWSAHVKVILPSSYSEETVGLCGNFNGNKGDDYLKLDGTQTKNVNEFGGSWKVGGDFGCTSDCQGGKCPECEPAMIPLYQGRRYCGIISDKEGPFSQCHSKLDHTEFLSDCVFDMCMYKGHASALCSSLSAFSSACQDAGAKVESWRSENFCPLSCPANSHYELCADPCQLTCSDLAPADGCDESASCGEDCVCDDGFIMSHDKCVPVAECGCQDGGQYYQNGQTFFRGQSCDTRCVCSDGGQIQCDSTFKCSEHEKCVLKDGSNSCEPKSIGSCSVSGVRTIRSFDGQEFPLWGDCLFILSEVEEIDGGKPAYSVFVEQKTLEDGSVSRNVVIKVEDTEFTMEAGVSWEVKVDGIRVSLPLSLNEGKVRVYQNGIHIVVETDFGLKLTYNTAADLVLQIPSTYHSAPSGLCGNFNADPSDDSKEGKGDPLAVAEFWVVEKDDVQCEVDCGDTPCPGLDKAEVPESQKACDIIKSAQGPFEGCHSSVSPTPFYDICVKEMATHNGGDKLLCQHIQSYVTQCQLAGAKIKEWRSDKFCPLTCPSGSHYDLCPSTSSSTCSSLQDSAAPPACQEGCQCDDDLLFDGAKCVPVEKCGCSVDGRYYKAGTSVLSEGCSKICSCESGVLSCEDFSCQEGEECSNKDGTIDCFSTVTPPPKDPCEDVQCRSKERCVNGECVHTSTSTCKAMGDPHFCTFDGRRYDFQGSCTYTMATVAKPADDLTPFTVTVKNNHRGSKRVSYVRTVTVTVHGQTIVISMAKGRVEVNGELQHLPVNLLEGEVTVRRSGGYALLATDFGLIVKYDWNMRLIITAPSSYFDHMGGLCGNYNGDKKDDLPDPKSKSIPIVLEMIKNWKVEDPDLFCSDNCGGRCPQCSLTQQEHFRNPKLCGLMSKEDGPFAACHKTVHPSGQLDDCVYDVCANNGAKKILCEHLEIYVESCLSEGVKVGAEWREQSGCIPSCPAGSHYESCGSACPASCSALDSQELCKDSCVGGCQCDEGRVLSGDRCVPQAQCGCQYQSKYYPAGAKFWGDNTCTSRCECKNGKAECEPVSCKKSEQCAVKKGIRDCYPTTYGSCKCSGDPHCRTFDNKKFDFQGTCTYVLAQLVEGSQQNLEPFQVLVTNEHRGRKTSVSFTKSAFLTVFGNVTVGMSRIKPGQITVNGQAVNLPFNFEDGKLIALRQRRFGVVKTYFGLTLKFDWSAHVKVILPSSYSEETVGLCGNFNGNKGDDYLKLDGTQTKNVNEFGGSWKVGGDFGCTSDCPGGKCPECEPAMIPLYQERRYCGIISDKEGPFSQCHSKLDHTEFLSDCVFDMCMYKGHASALCSSLSAFSSACQEAGAKVESWRSENFCPLSCPANSHYELCADPCQLTCSDLAPADGCDESASCGEDCVCDDGFIMSHDKCVPVADCGCQDGGQYYQNGQTFFRGQSCDTRCVCSDGGQIQCDSTFKCSEHEKCVLKDGSNSCEPKSIGSCSVSGVRTIRSFDGQEFPLWGDCLFILSEVEEIDGGKPAYSVFVEQKTLEDGSVSRNVVIKVEDTEFTMEAGVSWEVKVDGIRVSLPLSLNEGKVRVYQNGIHIVVETDFGLKLTYNTVADLVLQIPSTYHSAPSGLCGNFNADPSDDSMEGKGDPLAAAAFWVVEKDDVQCEVDCGDTPCPGLDKEEVPESQKACDIIKSAQGPFEGCHSSVSPTPFYDICVKEMATHKGGDKLLCQHIQSYVTQCQLAGAKIKEWRSDKFCPLTCPSGSHYDLCPSTSSSTCSSLQDSAAPPACQEGCQCDDDLLFDGAKCVPVEKCGCSVDGRYYKAGTSVLSEGCSKICSCESGVLSCKDFSCQEGEECSNKDGTIGCFSTDPCADMKCRVKEHCEVSEGQGECVPDSKAMCWAFGDPHFSTLDGMTYPFQGTCSYILLSTTGADSSLPDVTVTMKGELRGNSEGSFVHSVTVEMLGHRIDIPSGVEDMILVDGIREELPVTIEGRFSISQSGVRGTIRSDIGVEVTFDWAAFVMITLSSSYFGNVGGLCGNYNGNRSDDLTTAGGSITANVTDWAASWSTPDGDPFCFHHCEGECPQCSQEDRKKYTGPEFCGILNDKAGPFAGCHASVSVEEFVKDCLYDVCLNEGRQDVLCKALSAYMTKCQESKASTAPWREKAGCPLQCPEHGHYETCGSACPASCGPQPMVCPLICVEGCFCDDGYVMSGGECVIREKGCGCEYEGHYYKPHEEFWADPECHQKCVCNSATQQVKCKQTGCQVGEMCSILDGVQDCYPMSFKTCTARGDPHFTSFDGQKFDFQGNCVYNLASVCKDVRGHKHFEITLENENRNNKRVSYARAVTLKVFGAEFTLSRENAGKVLVDGLENTLPVSWNRTLVQVYQKHRHAVIETHFLKVSFDFSSAVKVELASSYEGATCGLCGNMNGDAADDLTLPNGQLAASANDFGVSQWVSDVEGCSQECKDCPPPLPSGVAPPPYTQVCDIIISKEGPLAGCIDLLDSKEFHKDCVYDMMLNNGNEEAACEIIRDYVEECLSAEGEVQPWRTEKFCPMKCPAKSEYSLKAPGCPVTCSSRSPPADCRILPSEGCVCKEGHLMSKDGCVKLAHCGCRVKGRFLEAGEGFYEESTCSLYCKCEKGSLICKKNPCTADETCAVVKGVRGCYNKEFLKK
ncbi:IgGFc-binding protein-like [Notolabrus celidotus]|uniref:IgGFc-binding protein-like n=1 Tax=Notolabrus celidotus TaxID=1203425 RepID=UPI0014908933|nr:IgGFc-binding protein-like [Notolabrus celidotus]